MLRRFVAAGLLFCFVLLVGTGIYSYRLIFTCVSTSDSDDVTGSDASVCCAFYRDACSFSAWKRAITFNGLAKRALYKFIVA